MGLLLLSQLKAQNPSHVPCIGQQHGQCHNDLADVDSSIAAKPRDPAHQWKIFVFYYIVYLTVVEAKTTFGGCLSFSCLL